MFRWIGSVGLIFALTFCLHAQDAPMQETLPPVLTVQVLDEAGNPVPNASVGLYTLTDFGGGRKGRGPVSEPSWLKTGADGKAAFPPLPAPERRQLVERAREWLLFVSAPNYLPVREILQPAAVKGATHTVRLRRGRPLEIVVRNETGRPLPEPLNLAVFRLHAEEVDALEYMESHYQYTKERGFERVRFQIHSQFGLESLGGGRYRCSLPEDYNGALLVIVHHPGFLRGFYTRIEPDAIQQGRAEIRLPKPCTLIIEADVSRASEDAYAKFTVEIQATVETGKDSTPFGYTLLEERVEKQRTITVDDLSPDSYGVELRGEPKQLGFNERESRPRYAAEWFFRRAPREKLNPDKPTRVQLAFAPPDVSQYRGDQQLAITVTMPDGKPAANQPYKLTVYDDSGRELTVLEGTLDSEGRATLTQLKELQPYNLYVANRAESAGSIYLGDTRRPQPTSFQVPPGVGDRAPDIVLRAVEGDAAKRLSDYRGKWIYLDFWATWCGPCRPALQKLKAELPGLKERYKDSLVAITLSIDDEPAPVKPYLEKMGLWGQCENFWAGLGGWNSPASRAFGIQGVPTAIVINPDGVIAWRGHPMTLNLQSVIASGQRNP
ncbi:MAG: redoxin domain-containing protein [Fimbriimonadales bacterium]|nr:redoxin domain-containing protein [Fimbriimonadales bacterium]